MLNLALMYFENARKTNNEELYKEASKLFRQLVFLEPNLARPYFYLGQLHEFGCGVTRDMKSAF